MSEGRSEIGRVKEGGEGENCPIADYRLPITDYQLPITDSQFPIIKYKSKIEMNSVWQQLTMANLPLSQWQSGSYLLNLAIGNARSWRQGSWLMQWAEPLGFGLLARSEERRVGKEC